MTATNRTNKPIIAVVGPTASGKSALGIELALRLDAEIINCDSVQVYQKIEIATAKVSMEERRAVPHHLIDFVSPEVNYTAVDWARDAIVKIAEIESRDRLAMLVGGTGFYLRALRQPFFPSPSMDEGLRDRLNQLLSRRGYQHMHEMLRRLDRASAERLHERDWPRIQRALEVRFQTGRSMSEQLSERPQPPECAHRIRIFALNPPRAELYERINRRTEAHFAAGLVDEVRDLLEEGVPASSTALGAHGYRRVVELLRGERSLESAIEQARLDVRHYAKRQLSWFRHESGVEWIEGFGESPKAVERVLARLHESSRESYSR